MSKNTGNTGQRIFITGGASGLGRALAERYAREGARILIGDLDTARCKAVLDSILELGGSGQAIACNVTKEEDLQAAAAWLQKNWGGVDIVFNNAGVAQAGRIDDVPLSDWQWIVDINLLGVVRGCKAFAPMLRKQRSGHIVNVASMAGLIHLPAMSAYNATKAAVVALSETLYAELADDGVAVSVVCPAFFRTNLAATMRTTDPRLEQTTRKLVERSRHSAEGVAEKVFRGVRARDFHILTHSDSIAAWRLKRYLPYRAFQRLMAAQVRKFAGKGGK